MRVGLKHKIHYNITNIYDKNSKIVKKTV